MIQLMQIATKTQSRANKLAQLFWPPKNMLPDGDVLVRLPLPTGRYIERPWARLGQQVEGSRVTGPWLSVGECVPIPLGGIVIVGCKRLGAPVVRVYVATPLGLVRQIDGTEFKLIQLPASERVVLALETLANRAKGLCRKTSDTRTRERLAQIIDYAACYEPTSDLDTATGVAMTIIRAGYRSLAKQHHPDVGGNTLTFQRMTEVYNQLMALVQTYE